MAVDYKLLPAHNGKRVRIVSDDNQDINIVVGDTLATWPEGTFIEILNLATDPTAIVTLVGDTGVIVRQYDASNILPYNHYARVSQVVPGEWDMHIYSALTLNDLTDVVITAPANNNVVLYDDTLLQWVNRPAPFVPTTQYKRMSYGGAPFDGSPSQGWLINDQGNDFSQPNYVVYDNDPYVMGFRFQQQGLYRVDWHIRAAANPWPPTGVTSFMSERFSGGVQSVNFRGHDASIVYRPQWEVGFSYSNNFTWSDSDLMNIGPFAVTNGNYFSLSIRAFNAAEVGETVDFSVVMMVQRINDGVDGA